jgi:hypothetical protein
MAFQFVPVQDRPGLTLEGALAEAKRWLDARGYEGYRLAEGSEANAKADRDGGTWVFRFEVGDTPPRVP